MFVAGGILVGDEALGWLDPTIESETVRWVAEATLIGTSVGSTVTAFETLQHAAPDDCDLE